MFTPVSHTIRNNTLWLSAGRCVFWQEANALIVSDLHFGKTGHFRSAGIAVPQSVFQEDLQRLFSCIQHYQPKELIITGDLFHSRMNKEMDLFMRWRNDLPQVDFKLVKGNHDILGDAWYAQAGIITYDHQYIQDEFCFTHDPESHCSAPGYYVFSGHIHPGIRINGMGKQSLQFPCYYFGSSYAVLPAFSRFTGLAGIQPTSSDSVFAIVNQSVIAITT
ncbi:putative phosphoesterase [Filimonas lacunae]|uniref:Putative phosphoesterase n=1 Tax=Filimonas lacunae TaxID=477680 RepID=A0A173MAS8_9BACT|nr:ligase-associated DNA damage response endonuclease PdeM [Filimonas lacunae]BAV04568.1 ICC-like protein phosphoesterase [Filimonas lacunae]SIT34786.1 putative phosphoesterase [Filimonas lacunae]